MGDTDTCFAVHMVLKVWAVCLVSSVWLCYLSLRVVAKLGRKYIYIIIRLYVLLSTTHCDVGLHTYSDQQENPRAIFRRTQVISIVLRLVHIDQPTSPATQLHRMLTFLQFHPAPSASGVSQRGSDGSLAGQGQDVWTLSIPWISVPLAMSQN